MRLFAVSLAALIAFLGCAPVFAADEKASHDHPAKYKAEVHVPGGKPEELKFDMANAGDRNKLFDALQHGHVGHLAIDEPPDLFGLKRWDVGIWSMVIFLILCFLLAKYAWKPMLEGLTKREEKIREALELAEKTRRDALEQGEKLQAQMRESAGQVAAMMDEGRRDAQALKEKMVTDAKTEIQSERDRLLREVESAKEQALQEIWQLSVTLATSMSAKAMGRAINEDDHRRFLDESLAELKQVGTGFGTRKLSGAGGI